MVHAVCDTGCAATIDLAARTGSAKPAKFATHYTKCFDTCQSKVDESSTFESQKVLYITRNLNLKNPSQAVDPFFGEPRYVNAGRVVPKKTSW